jgi:hypothetical protein
MVRREKGREGAINRKATKNQVKCLMQIVRATQEDLFEGRGGKKSETFFSCATA